jgi:hypothetical protein
MAILSLGLRDLARALGVGAYSIFNVIFIAFGAFPPRGIIGVALGGGGGGGFCCSPIETPIGSPLLRERRCLLARPSSVRRTTYDWSTVEACGPRCCAATSVLFFAPRLLAPSQQGFGCSIVSVAHIVVCVKSYCCGIDVCVAADAAIILGLTLGGGSGPLLEAPIVCIGGRPGIRPYEPPPRYLGGPPEGGGPGGGWFENHAELGCLVSLPFLLQCFRLRHFQLLP